MMEFPIGLAGLDFLIDQRTELLTQVLTFFTWLGEDEGYILIITGIYLMHDKKFAIRLGFLLLITMSINHLLKMLVGNPRPFVTEGSFMKKWAVGPDYASELATEYSTPSGHAMSSFAFYGYLLKVGRNGLLTIIAVITILLIGLSRPYLGVHYVEDILLGWGIALLVIVVTLKYGDWISNFWSNLKISKQIGYTFLLSVFLWMLTFHLKGYDIAIQPLPFVGHLGFIMGLIFGSHLEKSTINFDVRSGSILQKIGRWLITVVLVMMPLLIMDQLPMMDSEHPTYLTHLIAYVGYTLAGFQGIFVGPLLAAKLGILKPET